MRKASKREAGRLGGRAGRGAAKRRSHTHYVRIGKLSAKARAKKKARPLPLLVPIGRRSTKKNADGTFTHTVRVIDWELRTKRRAKKKAPPRFPALGYQQTEFVGEALMPDFAGRPVEKKWARTVKRWLKKQKAGTLRRAKKRRK